MTLDLQWQQLSTSVAILNCKIELLSFTKSGIFHQQDQTVNATKASFNEKAERNQHDNQHRTWKKKSIDNYSFKNAIQWQEILLINWINRGRVRKLRSLMLLLQQINAFWPFPWSTNLLLLIPCLHKIETSQLIKCIKSKTNWEIQNCTNLRKIRE